MSALINSQQRRVEQRNERLRNSLRAAVGELWPDGAQHGGWICQLHSRQLIGADMFRDQLDELAGEFDSLDTSVVCGSIFDGRLDDLCYVQRDAIGSLGVPKFVEIRSTLKLRMAQLLPQEAA